MTIKQHITNLDYVKSFIKSRNEEALAKGDAVKNPALCDIRDGEGVLLQCDTQAGTYSWYYQYTSPTTRKRNQKVGLGRFDKGFLPSQAHEEARRLARDYTSKGLDANEELRKEQVAKDAAAALAKENAKLAKLGKAPVNSFKWLAEKVLDEGRKGWKSSYTIECVRAFDNLAYPAFGLKQLAEITWADDIEPLQERILAGKRANSRGNKSALQKAMRFITAVFDEALERHIIKAIPIAHGKRAKARNAPPPTKHHAAHVSLTELGQLMMQLSDIQPKPVVLGIKGGNRADKTQARDALLVSLCTIQRRETVIAMRWENLDFDLGLWFIPRSSINEHGEEIGGTMKGRKVVQAVQVESNNPFHIVPLPRQILDMLQSIRVLQRMANKESAFVFPNRCVSRGDDYMGNTAMSELLNTLGWKGKLTQHGMRTVLKTRFTAAKGAMPKLPGTDVQFDAHLAIEIQMDHTHGERMKEICSDMPGTYYNGDMIEERRFIVQTWADMLDAAYKAAKEGPAAPAIEHDKPQLAHAAFLRRLAA